MVAANVGVTLLPALSVHAPVPRSDAIRLLPFRGTPPSRRIAMVWRKSSALGEFLVLPREFSVAHTARARTLRAGHREMGL
jgi:DNA-binding transcriptional LysR family regulator